MKSIVLYGPNRFTLQEAVTDHMELLEIKWATMCSPGSFDDAFSAAIEALGVGQFD